MFCSSFFSLDFKVDDRWENNTHCDYLPEVFPKTCGYIDVDIGRANGRPGGANHKGSVDFFRRPKPVFWVVSSQYEGETCTKASREQKSDEGEYRYRLEYKWWRS